MSYTEKKKVFEKIEYMNIFKRAEAVIFKGNCWPIFSSFVVCNKLPYIFTLYRDSHMPSNLLSHKLRYFFNVVLFYFFYICVSCDSSYQHGNSKDNNLVFKFILYLSLSQRVAHLIF